MVGLLWAAAILIGVAGAGKVVRPQPAVSAIRAASIPGSSALASAPLVRVGGSVEVLVAGCALIWGGPIPAALLAASYLLLTLVALRMIVVTPGTDCGCFGGSAEPVSRWHLLVNVGYFLVGAVAVFRPQPGVLTQVANDGADGVAVLALAGLLAWLSYLLITQFPALLDLRAKVAAAK